MRGTLLAPQDTYVILATGSLEKRTSTHIGGGRNSTWNEAFVFPVDGPVRSLWTGLTV